MADLSLLDQSVAKLAEAARDLPLADLISLLGAEQLGKTRKGAIAALEELVSERMAESAEPPESCDMPVEDETEPGMVEVENIVPGTTLHLGDGRRLCFGECALVSEHVAQLLTERGQVR